jgi:hypothetical protein
MPRLRLVICRVRLLCPGLRLYSSSYELGQFGRRQHKRQASASRRPGEDGNCRPPAIDGPARARPDICHSSLRWCRKGWHLNRNSIGINEEQWRRPR